MSDNWISFWLLFGLLVTAAVCQWLIGPAAAVWLAAMTLLVAIVVCRPSLADVTATTLLSMLVLATAIPFCVAYVYQAPLVQIATPMRAQLHRPDWIAIGLATTLLQCAALLFSGSGGKRRQAGLVGMISQRQRRGWIGIAASMAGMVAFTAIANSTESVLSGNYGAPEATAGGSFAGWAALYCICSAAYLIYTKLQRWYEWVFWYAIIAVWLFFGNRSEVFVQLVAPIALYLSRGDGRAFFPALMRGYINLRRIPAAIVILGLVFGLLEGVGLVRSNLLVKMPPDRESTALNRVLYLAKDTYSNRGVGISTIGPSAYTLLAVVGLTEQGTLEWQYLRGYSQYVYRILPRALHLFPDKQTDLADQLMETAHTSGGSHFAAEAYLGFGIVGATLFAYLIGIYFNILASYSSLDFVATWLLALMFFLPRLAWYGTIYMYKMTLVFLMVGLLIFLCRFAWAHLVRAEQR